MLAPTAAGISIALRAGPAVSRMMRNAGACQQMVRVPALEHGNLQNAPAQADAAEHSGRQAALWCLASKAMAVCSHAAALHADELAAAVRPEALPQSTQHGKTNIKTAHICPAEAMSMHNTQEA